MKKIIIADDNDAIRNYAKIILEESGYEVSCAKNGREAIMKIKAEKPDCVLLDIIMPDINGGEVRETLRNDPETEKIPVIYVTGLKDRNENAYSKTAQNEYMLAKPFLPAELRELTEIVMRSSEAQSTQQRYQSSEDAR